MNTSTVLRGAGFGALLLLAGCGGSDLSRTFGLTRDSPDEFVVTTRAPLSMPPDFTLRPPQPGAVRPQELSTTQSAQVTVAGAAALNPPPAPSNDPGLDALIAAAGPPPPPDIRARVDEEATKEANDRTLGEELMFWRKPPPPGTVVDAKKESDRLRDNAALGKSPDDGDTPIIQKKNKGLLEDLF
jgi:hypothetical protein